MHCCRGTGARQLQSPPHRHPSYSLPHCLVIASIARASGAAEPLTANMDEASYEARKQPLESDLPEQIEVRVRRERRRR